MKSPLASAIASPRSELLSEVCDDFMLVVRPRVCRAQHDWPGWKQPDIPVEVDMAQLETRHRKAGVLKKLS
jgi:hypothetical protein